MIGADLLVGIEPLQTAAQYSSAARTRCADGQGQPDGLAGDAIPLGARILSVAKGYHALQRGSVDGPSPYRRMRRSISCAAIAAAVMTRRWWTPTWRWSRASPANCSMSRSCFS
ncbi:MAG: hypothetical protein MZV65_34720 [Chromatiales bacterium]|nr:hypothetical protein [Chromatiales bacterium]